LIYQARKNIVIAREQAFPMSLRGAESAEAISKIGDCFAFLDERPAMTVESTQFIQNCESVRLVVRL